MGSVWLPVSLLNCVHWEEHPGASASHPALVHLRKEPVPISLDAISPSLVNVRAGFTTRACVLEAAVFWRQPCLGHSTGCQHRGCPAVGSEHSSERLYLGVVGLWIPGSTSTAVEPDAALGLQLCQGRLCCCALLRWNYSVLWSSLLGSQSGGSGIICLW